MMYATRTARTSSLYGKVAGVALIAGCVCLISACGDAPGSQHDTTVDPLVPDQSDVQETSAKPGASQTTTPSKDGGAPKTPSTPAAPPPSELTPKSDGGTPTAQQPASCKYGDGRPIPYDHSRGLIDEYSFELATDCNVGGYIAPLIEEDSVSLSKVEEYNFAVASWFRARILECIDDESASAPRSFLLVPPSQAAGMSRTDFDKVVSLFLNVLDRHDAMPDGLSASQKVEAKRKLKAYEKATVKVDKPGFTKPSTAPECAAAGDTPEPG